MSVMLAGPVHCLDCHQPIPGTNELSRNWYCGPCNRFDARQCLRCGSTAGFPLEHPWTTPEQDALALYPNASGKSRVYCERCFHEAYFTTRGEMRQCLLCETQWPRGVVAVHRPEVARKGLMAISGGSLPATINKAAPAGGDSPALGDDEFRALKEDLQDILGIPDNTAVTVAFFSGGATGVTGLAIATGGTITPAAVSGTPVAHVVYRESRVAAWARVTTGGTVLASFNVTSVVRNSAGVYTVTWARAFASSDYAVAVSGEQAAASGARFVGVGDLTTTTCIVRVIDGSALAADVNWYLIASGAQ